MSTEDYKKVQLNKIGAEHIGKKVRTFGWVEKFRLQKTMSFIDSYSGFKTVKCVYDGNLADELESITLDTEEEEIEVREEDLEILKDESKIAGMNKKEIRRLKLSKKKLENKNRKQGTKLTYQTSMEIFGTVVENQSSDGSLFEFKIERFEIFNNPAPSYPVTSESDAFTKLEQGHLYLRLPERRFFLKARSHLLRLIREFYYSNEYVEITPPTLVQTQVEGGSTLFKLDYYKEDAYLTQSSQSYLETVVPVSEKAFCAVQSYRAEKSNTRRHLSEYTHVEAEMAYVCFDELLDSIESLVKSVTKRFYADMREDILASYPDFKFIDVEKFERMTYKQAIAKLNEFDYKKEDGTAYVVGDDIPDPAERFLSEKVGRPIFLTNFLTVHKPFYMYRSKVDPETTESVDLLFPGVGEILGGSMRADKHEQLMTGFEREGINTDPYYWYTDMLKYGGSQHGGYGLGFERFLMAIMKYDSVNMACLYPRFVSRCKP